MKKILCLMTALLICLSLTVPAFASELDFVPSITAKPAPELDNQEQDTQGVPVIEVKKENEEIVHTAPVRYLVITSVAEAVEGENLVISEEKVETLKEAYEVLAAPDVDVFELVPELAEMVEETVKTETSAGETVELVVMDLFDVTILNEELEQHLNVDGHTMELTFAVNIPAEQEVYVMVYKEDKWQLIESAVNNGDGTVTCVFEHFCPVAILTALPVAAAPEAPAQTPAAFPWWIILLAAAVVVIILVVKRKSTKEKA